VRIASADTSSLIRARFMKSPTAPVAYQKRNADQKTPRGLENTTLV
jgi:hypothetical protein